MTLPDERIRAVKQTRDFMYALLDPKLTPKIPRKIRQWALRCLRHYPWDMDLASIFGDRQALEVVREAKAKPVSTK